MLSKALIKIFAFLSIAQIVATDPQPGLGVSRARVARSILEKRQYDESRGCGPYPVLCSRSGRRCWGCYSYEYCLPDNTCCETGSTCESGPATTLEVPSEDFTSTSISTGGITFEVPTYTPTIIEEPTISTYTATFDVPTNATSTSVEDPTIALPESTTTTTDESASTTSARPTTTTTRSTTATGSATKNSMGLGAVAGFVLLTISLL